MKQLHLGGWLLAALLAPAFNAGAEMAGQAPRATDQIAAGHVIQGSIIAVNMDKHRLQVRESDGRIVTVPLTASTKIIREGRSSSLSDLSVGQTVSVQQDERNGQPTATAIEVMPGGADQASANPGFHAASPTNQ